MRRRFQGLHQADQSAACDIPDGLFLVRVQRAQYRWHAQKPFYLLRFAVLEPRAVRGKDFFRPALLLCQSLVEAHWFLRDFGYDAELLGHDEVDDKNLVGLSGVVKISHTVLNGTTLLNLDGFAPASQWEELPAASPTESSRSGGGMMNYSYTQISQYLTCPRRYRYRYLDGWKQKDNRAAMLFGRAFEQALGALFRREDPGDVLFREWSACKQSNLEFSTRDSWDRMLRTRHHAP